MVMRHGDRTSWGWYHEPSSRTGELVCFPGDKTVWNCDKLTHQVSDLAGAAATLPLSPMPIRAFGRRCVGISGLLNVAASKVRNSLKVVFVFFFCRFWCLLRYCPLTVLLIALHGCFDDTICRTRTCSLAPARRVF